MWQGFLTSLCVREKGGSIVGSIVGREHFGEQGAQSPELVFSNTLKLHFNDLQLFFLLYSFGSPFLSTTISSLLTDPLVLVPQCLIYSSFGMPSMSSFITVCVPHSKMIWTPTFSECPFPQGDSQDKQIDWLIPIKMWMTGALGGRRVGLENWGSYLV